MIVAESVGFAATHSMSAILAGVPGFDVAHGSQDFITKADVGKGYQEPSEFLASMAESQIEGNRPVAIHTLYPPQVLKPLCDQVGIPYWLIVREPKRQISSCYAWIANKVFAGHGPEFATVMKVAFNEVANRGLKTSLSNCLYYYAINHVLTYNFVTLGLGTPFRKMEVLISDEAAFREAFLVPGDARLPHFEGEEVRQWAHSKSSRIEGLEPADREEIHEVFRLQIGDRGYTLGDLERLLGYES